MPSARKPLPLRHASKAGLLSALLLTVAVSAQESTLFLGDEPLAIRLEAPLRTVFADREDPEYQPARIQVANAQGEPLAVDLRVRVRGKSRTAACDFPPLLLNFPGKQPEGSPFAGENRLKLVTHCLASAQHEQHVVLERQIYLALNLLTTTSLRIRAVEMTYFDTDGERETANRIGFLIEDEEQFAARSSLAVVSTQRIDRARYDQSALALLDVFQYFIGNTDWSAVEGPGDENCCHNVVPYARPDGVLLPVPYDFDAAGIVESPYAYPSTQLPIRSVRQRLYRGSCRELSELAPVFAAFTMQREALTALFAPEAGIPERRAARAGQYIDQFYAILANEAQTEREFRRNCGR
jgi:hypothetical protein